MKILNRLYGYLKKDFFLFYKRKKHLYLFLGIPLVLSLFFIFALNPSGYMLSAGICDEDSSALSKMAFSDSSDIRYKIVDRSNCTDNLRKGITSGEFDLGIYIPAGFEKNINELKQSRILIYYDNTDIAFSNLIAWKVDATLHGFKRQIINSLNEELKSKTGSARANMDIVLEIASVSKTLEKKVQQINSDLKNIDEMSTEFIVNPVWTDKQPIYESELNKSSGAVYVFPIIALFTSLMLASTSLIYDKKSGFLTRVKTSSLGFSYLLSKVCFFIFLVLIQFVIVISLFFMNGARYEFSLLNAILLIVSVALINCLIGVVIGLISENEGIAVLFSLIISFPLMLVSGIFFPIQTLPGFIQYFSRFTPLSYQIAFSKAVLLFNQTFNNLWIYAGVILFIVCFWLIRKER
jgi:ABC-2 type transport system permease protein